MELGLIYKGYHFCNFVPWPHFTSTGVGLEVIAFCKFGEPKIFDEILVKFGWKIIENTIRF